MNDDFHNLSDFFDGERSPEDARLLEAELEVAGSNLPDWLAFAVGSYGDDHLAHRFADFVIEFGAQWEPESLDLALRALSEIGSPAALSQLQFIAWCSNAPALMRSAHAEFKSHADREGVRVWEIEDRVVPSCGLEHARAPRLEIADRAFRIYLDERFEPYLATPSRAERHYDLPESLAATDPDAARRWKTIRANLEDALTLQIRRLERVLQTQERWTSLDWNQFVFEHPLMALLGQRLVWGHYSKYGKLHGTFRIDEDYVLRGVDDELYEWPDEELDVGAAHPFDMSEELLARWSALLVDYEMVTIVPQFDRAVRAPAPESRKASRVELELSFDAEWLRVWLLSHGWVREREQWGWGAIHKIFRNADLLARLNVDFNDERAELRSVSFHRFLGYPQHSLQLRDVPTVVFSETLNEVDRMFEAFQAQADASDAARGT